MAIAYHTHTFSVPTADAADLLAGTEGGKVITPDVLGPVTAAGKALLSAANVAAQRAALDLEPGTDVQAYDADLAAIGALAKTDGNFIVGDGSTWVAESGATARASLGLAIGTDVQAYSANLDEYAAVNPTAAGLALLDDADASAQRTTLGLAIGTDVQAYDADLAAIAALAKTDGNFIVGDGTTWVAENGATARTSLGLGSAAVANLLDEDDMASDSATAVPSQQSVKAYVDANLGLVIGTDVQAYSANLDEYAAVNPTAAGLALLDDADASAQRTTLGLAIGTDVQAYDADLSAIAAFSTTGFAVRTASNTWAQRSIAGTSGKITVTNGDGVSGDPTITVGADIAQLTVADQVITGGARVTSLSLGTITSGTVTPDPGDRPMQHYTNNGAHTLAPGTNAGSYLLDITNGASAGAITTSGWTKVVGDAFTTTNGRKFRCSCSVGDAGSLLVVQAMQ